MLTPTTRTDGLRRIHAVRKRRRKLEDQAEQCRVQSVEIAIDLVNRGEASIAECARQASISPVSMLQQMKRLGYRTRFDAEPVEVA